MPYKMPIVLFFGYPSGHPSVGGLVWTKKVADYIETSGNFIVKKINNDIIIDKFDITFPLRYVYDVLKAFIINSDVVILNFYGEANLILWIVLRFFKPHTKILLVCHHYQERMARFKNHFLLNLLQLIYNCIINKMTKAMIMDSDRIITDSLSSAYYLNSVFAKDNKKIVIAGVGNDLFLYNPLKPRDIDFLCIGRYDKFKYISKIWQLIKQKSPEANFIMCGHGRQNEISEIRKLGADHRGVVSEKEKIELYSRAKVLLFPSLIEGFSIVVAEALYAGLHVVTWKLPVFEETYGSNYIPNIKLIEQENYETFAEEAICLLKEYSYNQNRVDILKKLFEESNNWGHVGEKVISTIKEVISPLHTQ